MEKTHLLEIKDLKVSFASKKTEVPAIQGISYYLDEGEVSGNRGRVRKRKVRFFPLYFKAPSGKRKN